MTSLLAQLQQENDRLRSQLDTCQQSHQDLQERVEKLEEYKHILEARERILEATASAANALSTIKNLDKAVNTALQIVGEGVDTDSIVVLEHVNDSSGESLGWLQALYEWDSPHTVSQITHSELKRVSYEGIEDAYQLFSQGQPHGCIIDEMPESFRSGQKLGAKAIYRVPIMVGGRYWGIVCLDDCREKKRLTLADIAVFKTAASCVGSAIQRDRDHRAREEAERRVLLEREQAATERAKAELKDSQQRLALLIQKMPVAIVEWNTKFEIKEWNPAAERIFGYSREEVLGLPFSFLVPDSAQAQVSQIVSQLLRQQGAIWSINENLTKDNRTITCDWYNTPLIAVNGELIGVASMALDITDRQQAEAACQQANELLEQRVAKRTAELAKLNEALQLEVGQRQRAEQVARGQTEALVNTLTVLAAEPVLDNFLGYVLQAIADQLGDRTGGIYLYDEAHDTTIKRISYEDGQVRQDGQISHPGASTQDPPKQWDAEYLPLLRQNQILIHDEQDFAKLPAYAPYRQHNAQRGIKTLLFVPLLFGETFLGNISLGSRQQRDYKPEELELARVLAYQATLAIQLTRLAQQSREAAVAREQEKAAQERTAELTKVNRALRQTLDVLATEPELDRCLGHVITALVQQLAAASATLWLYNLKEHTATLHLLHEQDTVMAAAQSKHPNAAQPILLDSNTAWWSFKSVQRYPFIYEDVPNHSMLLPAHRQYLSRLGIQTVLSAPLVLGTQTVGSICLHFRETRQFRPEELELVQALANQATLAIQLTQLAEAAKQAAIAREQEKAESAILEERNRMAREIHDTLAQGFTGIITHLEAAKRALTQNPAKTLFCISSALKLGRESLAEARRSVWALRPQTLDSGDLGTAFRRLTDTIAAGSVAPVELHVEGQPRRLRPEVEYELLRIGQEALHNALKHAHARNVTLKLIYDRQQVMLHIHDNGRGFDLQLRAISLGFGLICMQERADRVGARLGVQSVPGQGTIVTVVMPVAATMQSSVEDSSP